MVAADDYSALYCSRGYFERSGTNAQHLGGARFDYFHFRSEPGVGSSGWSCESIGPIHRRHYVTINESILPLLFVSPQQINAQLPSSLTDGTYTLNVQNTGQPEIPEP